MTCLVCKNVFACKLAKKIKSTCLLVLLLYHTSHIAFSVWSVQVFNNNIIYQFQKYICLKLLHIFSDQCTSYQSDISEFFFFSLITFLVIKQCTLLSCSYQLSLVRTKISWCFKQMIPSLLIKQCIADEYVLNKLFIVYDVRVIKTNDHFADLVWRKTTRINNLISEVFSGACYS